jgi:cytochrome b pre-mRNA-processing protein 3
MALFGWKLFGGGGRSGPERIGYELYGAAVTAARQPFFYAQLGVPDTLNGRFDMVGLHAFLLIRRLTSAGPQGARLAQAVFDAMFHDMDVNLREMGVGDLSVGKKVRVMWEAFHGRAAVYADAMAVGPEALAEALERNVWPDDNDQRLAAANLARLAYAQDAHLSRLSLDQIRAGQDLFVDVAQVFA